MSLLHFIQNCATSRQNWVENWPDKLPYNRLADVKSATKGVLNVTGSLVNYAGNLNGENCNLY